jgi:hypothetical protein
MLCTNECTFIQWDQCRSRLGEHGSVQGRTTLVVVHVGVKVAVDGAGWEAVARVMAMGGFYKPC